MERLYFAATISFYDRENKNLVDKAYYSFDIPSDEEARVFVVGILSIIKLYTVSSKYKDKHIKIDTMTNSRGAYGEANIINKYLIGSSAMHPDFKVELVDASKIIKDYKEHMNAAIKDRITFDDQE